MKVGCLILSSHIAIYKITLNFDTCKVDVLIGMIWLRDKILNLWLLAAVTVVWAASKKSSPYIIGGKLLLTLQPI